MKIKLAENISEITLGQFQAYLVLLKDVESISDFEFNSRKIEIFTGVSKDLVKNMNDNDYKDILLQIEKALESEVGFKNKFTLDGIDFGFIPNFDKMTAGENGDLKEYLKDFDPSLFSEDKESLSDIMKQIRMSAELYENMHRAMAILFRPIAGKDMFGNYMIENYNGTEATAELMKQAPLNIVKGALVFFSSLAKDLRIYIQKFTMAEAQREKKRQIIGTSGVGTQQ